MVRMEGGGWRMSTVVLYQETQQNMNMREYDSRSDLADIDDWWQEPEAMVGYGQPPVLPVEEESEEKVQEQGNHFG